MSRRTPTRLFAAALALAAVAVAGGCATSDGDTSDGATTDRPSAGSGASFPVTVGKLTLDKRPEKIVSLTAAATEMLFAIGAGAQVTAVDDRSNYPPEAPKSELSGFQPSAEAIAAKDPDLVVISNDINKIVGQLAELRIPVYLASAAVTLDDTYRELTELGALTGHPDEARAVTDRMKSQIAEVVKSVPQRSKRPTYYYELDTELYSATSKTFIGELFTMAGLDNIADAADPDGAKGGYPQLSAEYIIKANPDFVFFTHGKWSGQSPATVKARKGWSGVTAVKQDQIIALDDDIASRWGPRVVDLLRTIVAATAKANG